jgi:phosphoribosylformimino-5-aminoimidazole carboxamide ribotide isomerase
LTKEKLMLIIPAIDLKDGACVRLRQGRMEDSTVFSDDPVSMAAKWVEGGCRRLHLVDLNGAFEGQPVNGDVVTAIARRYPNLPIQIGGGIRSLETIEHYVKAGVSYVIIGTKAVKQPEFVAEACRAFPGKVIVGLDAKDGFVATDGWAEVSTVQVIDLAKRFEADGVSAHRLYRHRQRRHDARLQRAVHRGAGCGDKDSGHRLGRHPQPG